MIDSDDEAVLGTRAGRIEVIDSDAEAVLGKRVGRSKEEAARVKADLSKRRRRRFARTIIGEDAGARELALHSPVSQASMPGRREAVLKALLEAEHAREINPSACQRLRALFDVLEQCLQDNIVDYVITDCRASMCILGWQALRVRDLLEFRRRLLSMVNDQAQTSSSLNKPTGAPAVELKNPGWGVYELLRGIGVKPQVRGPVESEPSKTCKLYYESWCFKNDESFKVARQRLAKAFQYNPERGNRPRKKRA